MQLSLRFRPKLAALALVFVLALYIGENVSAMTTGEAMENNQKDFSENAKHSVHFQICKA